MNKHMSQCYTWLWSKHALFNIGCIWDKQKRAAPLRCGSLRLRAEPWRLGGQFRPLVCRLLARAGGKPD